MKNIYFIGFMGVGKSTISYRVSRILKKKIIDTDRELEKRQGKAIHEIFTEKGELYFRKLESELLREISQQTDLIISCGGGMILKEENRKLMKDSGIVVLLTATINTIYRRVALNDRRPLLKGKKTKAHLRAMYSKREPIYKELADIEVSINRKTVSMISEEVITKVKEIENHV
ncbi:shikimate kinase [Lachnospiraceae bacterium PM6-15]|uniref:shikimate kinase n=1 Tax=Ohessyouella blattaphilus TaxID=2949333 RepID=UPI003E1A57A3